MYITKAIFYLVFLGSLCLIGFVSTDGEAHEGEPEEDLDHDHDHIRVPPEFTQQKKEEGIDMHEHCIVEDYPVEEDFNTKAFMGQWYVIADSGLFPMQRTLDKLFHLIQDMKSYFELEEDGSIKVVTGLRSFLLCSYSVGKLTVADKDEPAKMEISYPNSWMPSAKQPAPFWVIATDYDNYAVIYSCRKVNDDGKCDKGSQVSYVLSRDPKGLNKRDQGHVDEIVTEVCFEPEHFNPMPRTRPCNEINPEDFKTPKNEL